MSETSLEKKSKVGPLLVGALGVLYGLSPVDLVPDVVPIAGWFDDLVISGGAVLHVVEAYAKDYSKGLASMIKMVKWLVWLLGGILVLLIALFGVAIYNIVA